MLGGGERDDGEASLADQRRVGEQLIGLDFGEGDRPGQRFSGFNLDGGILGIGEVHGNDGRGADRALAIPGLVDDERRARSHFAKVAQGDGIGHAVPHGDGVALEIREGVFGGFGLEQIGGRHGRQAP